MKILKKSSHRITDKNLKMPWYIAFKEIYHYNIIMFIRIEWVPVRMYINSRKEKLKNKQITLKLILNEIKKVLFEDAIEKHAKKETIKFWNEFFERVKRREEWHRKLNE